MITESRESGNTGIYNSDGNIEKKMVAKIISKINIKLNEVVKGGVTVISEKS